MKLNPSYQLNFMNEAQSIITKKKKKQHIILPSKRCWAALRIALESNTSTLTFCICTKRRITRKLWRFQSNWFYSWKFPCERKLVYNTYHSSGTGLTKLPDEQSLKKKKEDIFFFILNKFKYAKKINKTYITTKFIRACNQTGEQCRYLL